MSDAPADLAVENLTKTFTTAGGDLSVLRNLNLTMQRGESVVVTGPSGSGKSTLLYIVGTLDEPTSGAVRILGQDVLTGSETDRARYRNANIGFVFQDHHLLPQCTVLENVLIPRLAGDGAVAHGGGAGAGAGVAGIHEACRICCQ